VEGTLFIGGDIDADRLLNTDPFALPTGTLLDQQTQQASSYPRTLDRRGGRA